MRIARCRRSRRLSTQYTFAEENLEGTVHFYAGFLSPFATVFPISGKQVAAIHAFIPADNGRECE